MLQFKIFLTHFDGAGEDLLEFVADLGEGEDDDYRISSFIINVVKSDPFRMRMADVVAEEEMESER